VEDVSFDLPQQFSRKEKEEFPFLTVNRLSWSSWGFSSINEEEMEDTCNKSINYLMAELDKVTIIRDKLYVPVAKEFWAWVQTNIKPLKNKYYEIESSISALKTQQQLSKNINEKQKAIQFFKQNEGKEIIFHEGFYYNNKSTTNRITIGSFKKDKVQITFYDMNKRYDEDKMLELYKHIMKRIKISHVDYSKDWDDETRTSYQEFDNISNSDLDKLNMKEITKEEYRNR